MKKNKTVFQGVATALITPFNDDGIDYEKFGRLIDWQIEKGVNALVICGTTGESSTLSDDEHRDAVAFAVKKVNKRIPVIAGAGSNDTKYALDLAKCACEDGADALLCVTPYYNKCTQGGLIKMFTEIADVSTVPVILYNVPSRTGLNIEPSTYLALSEHPNIAGIKEASGNMKRRPGFAYSFIGGKRRNFRSQQCRSGKNGRNVQPLFQRRHKRLRGASIFDVATYSRAFFGSQSHSRKSGNARYGILRREYKSAAYRNRRKA